MTIPMTSAASQRTNQKESWADHWIKTKYLRLMGTMGTHRRKHLTQKERPMTISKKRLLIDTSVLRGLFDEDTPERTACTERFIDLCRTGIYELFVCPVFTTEVKKATAKQLAHINELIEELHIEILPENDEATTLAQEYKKRPLKTAKGDRLHLAYATVFECDTVVSWNMHDLVNEATYKGTWDVNTETGRKAITVETPAMIMGEGRPEWLPSTTP